MTPAATSGVPAGAVFPAGVTAHERQARAHLSRVVEPGDAQLAPLLARHGAPGLVRLLERGGVPERWVLRHRRLGPGTDRMMTVAAAAGIRVVMPGDREWPVGLDVLPEIGAGAVACLWVRGRLPASVAIGDHGDAASGGTGDDPGGLVAVVGARDCTPYGEQVAGDLGAGLASAGLTVVSGAALGIDAAAHRGALSVVPSIPSVPSVPSVAAGDAVVPDGPPTTVAVLGCGVDRAYPAAHARLLTRIVEAGGGVISELPPGASPYPWRFPARNRIIAALAEVTVVVEAGVRSGALGTARIADALSKEVAAVPGPVHSRASAGCHVMLRDGQAHLVRGLADVLELLGDRPGRTPADPGAGARGPGGTGSGASGSGATGSGSPETGSPRLDPVLEQVLRCLPGSSAAGAATTESVAVRAGLDLAPVRAALLDLEALGRATRSVAGWRRAGRGGHGRGG